SSAIVRAAPGPRRRPLPAALPIYVEFPPQLHEMWRVHPQVLPHYAKHLDTGEPMPAELVAALVDSERFGQGFDTIEYLAAAMLDLSWHSLEAVEHITAVISFHSE